ncbi:MAG TPA: Rieske 2Fe-2S domain-containing protein [Terrimicrobiaceae bacterium]|nr:Rieske 2Fe-2S domain-containing protein [Terrimicrobiaceae bacterium]
MITHNVKKTEKCACEGKRPTRRDFLLGLGIGLNVIAGAMISIPIIGYVMSSFVQKLPLKWISLGPVDKFPEGTTRLAVYENPYQRPWDGKTAEIPCWVRRIKAEEFQVFAINCTHLGCPVRWFEESKLFMCPCHGGAYYEDGSHASGPPPRGLYTYDFKVENNELFVSAGLLPTLANPHV